MDTLVFASDDFFRNFVINGEWNLAKMKYYLGDTPAILIRMLQRRNCPVDLIKFLLKKGADINCTIEEDGFPALATALVYSNDEAIIRVLLEGGAEVDEPDRSGRTPLLRYLKKADCSVSIVKLLLDFGADVNQMDDCGDFPLARAIRTPTDDAVIRLLVERCAIVNDLRNLYNIPLLVYLKVNIHCFANTVEFLLAEGADVHCVDAYGRSPLMIALDHYRDKAVIEVLLENGAEVNKMDRKGRVPLVSAIKFKREAVIQVLLENGANPNFVCKNGETPLLLYLGKYFPDNCSDRIVKLLLQCNADVNCVNSDDESPLKIALEFSRSEAIIRMLLDAGANVDVLDWQSSSPLCVAFKHSSNDIVKLLLDAGSSPEACKCHSSALYCATDFSHSGLREDILKLLLAANMDVNSIDTYGQSLLCFALTHGAKSCDIQLLMAVGASLNACVEHSSPLMCAIEDGNPERPLREDVVQLLLDKGACLKEEDLKVLQDALGCKYETGAIRLLLDLPGMDAYVVANKLLLHLAVSNPCCRVDALKLLVNRKAQVLAKNEFGDTPLHIAVKNEGCDPSVINLLLRNGSPVNAKNKFGQTPLMLALDYRHSNASIFKELLLAGADIGKAMIHPWLKSNICATLVKLIHILGFGRSEIINPCYKMLAKFVLLQNPEFGIENFREFKTRRTNFLEKARIFLIVCLNELAKMQSLQVGLGHTFRMFVSRVDCTSTERNYDMNKIFMFLMKNTFPVFFDVISARISRSITEAEVKKLQVYTNKTHPVGRVYLNCDVLCNISKYLPNEALLNFILAFYKPVDQNNIDETRKTDTPLGKRKSELSTDLPKHQKLQYSS